MSKLNATTLQQSIETMLTEANAKVTRTKKTIKGKEKVYRHRRRWPESIELQVTLKQYDTQKDKRFSGSVRLPRLARPRFKVCVIGDAYHEEQAQKLKIPSMNVEDLKKLNKNKKLVKKMCQQHDAFLASESLIKTIPRIVGPHMNRAGKFPTAIAQGEDLQGKVTEIRSTIKFALKKTLVMNAVVGHVKMNVDDVRLNVTLATNFLVSLLKKNWQNMKSVNLKSTFGHPFRLY
eukprot:NODE_1606_length_900_cov_456.063455_g1251_i0.p2 GENE.NODE_1606_length_900_cov_456.063455_g1251_i0~~NODE_1606_length_900_cov_456.063455_g1251_i0.p2  ORF type:complete len:255 (-),score=69.55 NODE_1606_length_900_cov_456.063455_g1251_i0:134-835(-)